MLFCKENGRDIELFMFEKYWKKLQGMGDVVEVRIMTDWRVE